MWVMSMVFEDKKLLELIGIILQMHGGVLYSKTKLVKLLFLIDKHFANKYGAPLTNVKYRSYFYGPYSGDIESALDYLTENGYITMRYVNDFIAEPYYELTLIELPKFSALSEKEKEEVRDFISRYVSAPLKDILEEVYQTEEYKNTEFGEVIKFGELTHQ